jgi:hypothetical protein
LIMPFCDVLKSASEARNERVVILPAAPRVDLASAI